MILLIIFTLIGFFLGIIFQYMLDVNDRYQVSITDGEGNTVIQSGRNADYDATKILGSGKKCPYCGGS